MHYPTRRSLVLSICVMVSACGGSTGGAPTLAPRPSSSPPSTVVSPSPPSTAPEVIPATGPIEPGSHRIAGPFPATFDLVVGDAWSVYAADGCCVLLAHDRFEPPGLVMFSAWTIDAVYADPCRHVLGPTVGPGVEALVAALRAVPALGAGTPTDATIDGRPATHLTLDFASDIDLAECVNREFGVWAWKGEETRYVPPGYRDAVDELWILEVDGTRIVLDGSLSEATDADRAELDAIVQSVRFR
jgi:hypothetical protein